MLQTIKTICTVALIITMVCTMFLHVHLLVDKDHEIEWVADLPSNLHLDRLFKATSIMASPLSSFALQIWVGYTFDGNRVDYKDDALTRCATYIGFLFAWGYLTAIFAMASIVGLYLKSLEAFITYALTIVSMAYPTFTFFHLLVAEVIDVIMNTLFLIWKPMQGRDGHDGHDGHDVEGGSVSSTVSSGTVSTSGINVSIWLTPNKRIMDSFTSFTRTNKVAPAPQPAPQF